MDLELELAFSGELWYWRGPAPFHFITVPPEGCAELRGISSLVSYGWGMIPVTVRIGGREFTTALFPKDGRYLVPVKDVVRSAHGLVVGDTVAVHLVVRR